MNNTQPDGLLEAFKSYKEVINEEKKHLARKLSLQEELIEAQRTFIDQLQDQYDTLNSVHTDLKETLDKAMSVIREINAATVSKPIETTNQ